MPARLAGTVGLSGAFLPVLPCLGGTKARKAAGAASVIALLAVAYAWNYTGFLLAMLVPLWLVWYARAIWPSVNAAFEEQERRQTPRWERWLMRVLLGVILALALFVGGLYLWYWLWGRHPH